MMALTLRDFDAESERVTAINGEEAAAEMPVYSFTEEELGKLLADARAQGTEQGLADGIIQGRRETQAEHQVQATTAMQNVQDQLAVFVTQDRQRRTELERDLVDMVLDICERVVPDLLRAFSVDQVQARLQDALHIGSGYSTLTLLLSEKTEAALGAELTAIAAANGPTKLTITADPNLKDSEARMAWENGFMNYSLDRVCTEIMDALRHASEQMKHQTQKV